MNFIWQILFWSCLAGLAYIYAGYPLLICLLSHRQRSTVSKAAMPFRVSVVIVAHNEQARLPRKIDNLLSLDGADLIDEILIGSDGSTDDTVAVVKHHADPRVKVVHFLQRRGKPAVLNDLVPRCSGELVLLSDCRQVFDREALVRLVENFADPSVGVVSGELILRRRPGETTAAQGIGFYWKYEKFIRKCESRFRGVPGATGACYVIRKSLFRPINPKLILDDVAIPLQAVLQGYRCLLEPRAVAFDEPSTHPGQEAIRKQRTIAGAAQLVREHPEWLNPSRNPIWWEFVSHKVLRLASPFLLAGALAANLLLVEFPEFQMLLALQSVFYLAALAGYVFQRVNLHSAFFGPPLMFVALNVTTALALWDALRSRYQVMWQRIDATDDATEVIAIGRSVLSPLPRGGEG
jgi:cellulose synthase/poly-beta-1,6-N-acetylglucosamine synthase-like glycosyltransferase